MRDEREQRLKQIRRWRMMHVSANSDSYADRARAFSEIDFLLSLLDSQAADNEQDAAAPSSSEVTAADEILNLWLEPDSLSGEVEVTRETDALKVAAILSRYFGNSAAAPGSPSPAEPPDSLRNVTTLCRSGEGRPKVELWFKELTDAQAVHKWLTRSIAALRTSVGEKSKQDHSANADSQS